MSYSINGRGTEENQQQQPYRLAGTKRSRPEESSEESVELPISNSSEHSTNPIVDDLLSHHPSLQMMNADGKQILSELLDASVESKSILDFRNPRRAQLYMMIQSRKQAFLACCENEKIELEVDDAEEPSIFNSITEKALELSEQQRYDRMLQTIQGCRGEQVCSSLSRDEIPALYAVCTQELQRTASIRNKLEYLQRRSGLPADQIMRYSVQVQHSGVAGFPVHIKVLDPSNLLMGYSVFDLLFSIQIRTGIYDGETEYILNGAEADKLETYLSGLVTWIDDFTNILAELIGPDHDPEKYIELAQRTRREIINQPIRMSDRVLQALEQIDVPICMIMGHLSLNLVQHPHRDFLKAKFQELYDREGVLDSEGKAKHFHIDEPYRSNLGLVQLKQICPRLNKLIKFQQLATKFTGTQNLSDALQSFQEWGCENELEVMIQYKIQTLLETYRMALGDETPSNTASQLDLALADLQELDHVETKSLELYHSLLLEHMAPYFKTEDAEFSPTQEQINAIYDGVRTIRYEGRQRHRNVRALFTSLQNAPPFQEVVRENPGFSNAMSQLLSELVHHLNQYHELEAEGFYGQAMIDETVRYFEQYVARVVYAEEAKVTAESINRSLQILSGLVGSDMERGCVQGLAGRMKDVLIALSRSTGDGLRDHIRQFQKECLEEVCLEDPNYRNGPENSMAARDKGQVADFLGLSLVDQPSHFQYNQLSDQAKNYLRAYLGRCTSWSIYAKAYQYLCDRFWELNSEHHDQGIFDLFRLFGFEGTDDELNARYRVNGNPEKQWQYAFFQQDLPRHLIRFLLENQYLVIKPTDNQYLCFQRDGESLQRMRRFVNSQRSSRPPQEQQDPQSIVQTDERRYGYVPESSLPNYDRMTS